MAQPGRSALWADRKGKKWKQHSCDALAKFTGLIIAHHLMPRSSVESFRRDCQFCSLSSFVTLIRTAATAAEGTMAQKILRFFLTDFAPARTK